MSAAASRLSPVVSAVVALIGVTVASNAYPGGFDWQYQVMSALASSIHNPAGGRWFAAALAAALLLLWPVTTRLRSVLPAGAGRRLAVGALRTGIGFGALTGLERLLIADASAFLDKSHELLALLSFVALYTGVVATCVVLLRRRWQVPGAAMLLTWFTALGAMLVYLWLGQRELGWVGREWRALGIPLWRSFAFWQWIACASVLFAFAAFAWMPRRRHAQA